MINFFRKIRARFLEQKKIKKYIPYAIGEIILTVIGILIAIYINDKAKSSEERHRILQHYNNIHRELGGAINLKNYQIERIDSLKEIVTKGIEILGVEDSLSNLPQYLPALMHISIRDQYIPITEAFVKKDFPELESHNNIRFYMEQLIAGLEMSDYIDSRGRDHYEIHVMSFFREKINLTDLSGFKSNKDFNIKSVIDYKQFYNDIELQNLFIEKLMIFDDQEKFSRYLIGRMRLLDEEIIKELGKNLHTHN